MFCICKILTEQAESVYQKHDAASPTMMNRETVCGCLSATNEQGVQSSDLLHICGGLRVYTARFWLTGGEFEEHLLLWHVLSCCARAIYTGESSTSFSSTQATFGNVSWVVHHIIYRSIQSSALVVLFAYCMLSSALMEARNNPNHIVREPKGNQEFRNREFRRT